MIPDDEDVDPHIDFSWFYFIGVNKLGLTYRQTGRITLTLFNKLYTHYKNAFDLELRLKQAGTTYAEAYKKLNQSLEWF